MFNVVLGTDDVAMNVLHPRFISLIDNGRKLIKLFGIIRSLKFMETEDYKSFAAEIDAFIAMATNEIDRAEKIIIELRKFEFNLDAIQHCKKIEFRDTYHELKRGQTSKTAIVIYDRLLPFKDNIENMTDFVEHIPGPSWAPFPFTHFNVKALIFDVPSTGGGDVRVLVRQILKKALELTKLMYQLLFSPDIDVDKFTNVMKYNLDQLRKVPRLSRCNLAWTKISQSMSLFKTNINKYYRDMIISKDRTIIFQHFITDVGKTTNADAVTMRQFHEIIQYYQEISKEQTNMSPEMRSLMDKLGETFHEMEKGTRNLSFGETAFAAGAETSTSASTNTSTSTNTPTSICTTEPECAEAAEPTSDDDGCTKDV
jgi:hypothetical protein